VQATERITRQREFRAAGEVIARQRDAAPASSGDKQGRPNHTIRTVCKALPDNAGLKHLQAWGERIGSRPGVQKGMKLEN
jgi:hypothetical protein